jgi:RNA polymerase sigma-70 factor (ECF subfamily)
MVQQPAPSTTSLTLMERVRAFESDAWERLCQIYGPLVFQWARRAGLSDDDAADVMQETFQTVARRVASFQHDGAGSTFCGWLRGITRNKIGDYYRKRAAEPHAPGGTAAHQVLQAVVDPLGDEDHDPSAADEVLGIAQRALLLIRGEFETRTWDAFRLCVMESRSTDTVAAELQMTPKAVRQAKYRVLKRLRQEVIDEFD